MRPAARLGDQHTCPMPNPDGSLHAGGPIVQAEPRVQIANQPAARVSDQAYCLGPPDMIVTGAGTVLITGMMAARVGDVTVHGGLIVLGESRVLIGDAAAGAGGATGATMRAAQAEGSPFCELCCEGQGDT